MPLCEQETGRTFQVQLETPEGRNTIFCNSDEYIWYAAARNGIALPAVCRQGRCLSCAGRVLSGIVDQSDADSVFPEDKRSGFVLLCRARPCSDLVILTHQQWEMRSHRVEHNLPAPYM